MNKATTLKFVILCLAISFIIGVCIFDNTGSSGDKTVPLTDNGIQPYIVTGPSPNRWTWEVQMAANRIRALEETNKYMAAERDRVYGCGWSGCEKR